MKTTPPFPASALAALFLGTGWAWADEKPVAPSEINGVKGVKQEAVPSIRKVEPPTANAAVVNQAQGTTKVNGVNTVNGVKADGREAVQPVAPVPPPPPPPAGSATQAGGGSVGAVSSIRAVQGVQGINVPKQQNLEAALLVKGAPGAPTAKGQGAAAALFKGPPGGPPKNAPGKDGRAGFQEFEKLNTPGS